MAPGMAGKLVALPSAGAGALALGLLLHKWKQPGANHVHDSLMPRIVVSPSGKFKDIESFGDYGVRQLGLNGDSPIAKTVCKAAEGYLRDDSRKATSESKEIVCMLVSGPTQEENEKDICQDMLLELEVFVVTYFSFHWKHTASIIEKRYDKVLKSLSTKCRIHTLIEEMKAIGKADDSMPDEGLVTIPAESSKRSPVILFIGGGMGAGKCTAVKEILSSSFWSGVIKDAVVVEADAFKETDVIYQSLNLMSEGDVSWTSELVHRFSTDAANSLLVSALNEGRDVIFDGTMSWEPFVLQTMAMVRDIHNKWYRMGLGYKQNKDGTETEKYWEPLANNSECAVATKPNDGQRPYRIEFVGVVCDAHLAVIRGMRRAISTKRAVPVKGHRSHKMFAKSEEKYMSMVDAAKIYSTSAWNGPAELIAVKDGPGKKLLVDVDTYPGARCLRDLNTDSGSELYSKTTTDENLVYQFWQNMILDPKRKTRQERLRTAILANAPTSVLLEKTVSQLSEAEANGIKKEFN